MKYLHESVSYNKGEKPPAENHSKHRESKAMSQMRKSYCLVNCDFLQFSGKWVMGSVVLQMVQDILYVLTVSL